MKKSEKYIPLSVHLNLINESFKIQFAKKSTKVPELRGLVEIASGIPNDFQILYYLDKGDLAEDSDIQKLDIVPNSKLQLEIWITWQDLISCVTANKTSQILKLGVTINGDYKTPNSEFMFEKERRQWIQRRADVALMVAAHRGHQRMCEILIENGANVNSCTNLGRTPLHFAATQNHAEVIDLLLAKGADIDQCDANGENALTFANKYGHKSCERHLFMFRWQQRAKNLKPEFLNPPMMAFQMCDSTYPKWKNGPIAQCYLQKLLPPGEFIGSALNATRRNWHRRCSETKRTSNKGEQATDEEDDKDEKEESAAFDEWMRKKQKARRLDEAQKKKRLEKEAELAMEILQKRKAKSRSRSVNMNNQDQMSGDELGDLDEQLGQQKSGKDHHSRLMRRKVKASRESNSTHLTAQQLNQSGNNQNDPIDEIKNRVKSLFYKHGYGTLTRSKSEFDQLTAGEVRERDEESRRNHRDSVFREWQDRKNFLNSIRGSNKETNAHCSGSGNVESDESLWLMGISLPYQAMIKDFCNKKCHVAGEDHH